jgi:hypothetical protein
MKAPILTKKEQFFNNPAIASYPLIAVRFDCRY